MKFTKQTFICALHNNAKTYIETLYAQNSSTVIKEINKNFSSVDFLQFDWISGPNDRGWWWKIQQLQPLLWYLRSNQDRNSEDMFSFTSSLLHNWIQMASQQNQSPLVWHDHATAFRFINIAYWLVHAATHEKLNKINDNLVNIFFNSFHDHVLFLLDEKNYSRHTNHGYDQSISLYIVSLLLQKDSRMKSIGKIALSRLHSEINFAFTKQGVHKENSPGYHSYMMRRLRLLDTLDLLGGKTSKKIKKLLDDAQIFLNAVTLPDGTLPLIGDTPRSENPGTPFIPQKPLSCKIFDYTSSGWFIAVGRTAEGKIFHLIVKAGHFSNYHRHDDDLSIHLYFDGSVVLGDAGLYLYQEQDPNRLFVRSNLAHNTVFPCQIMAIRDNALLSAPPRAILSHDGTRLTVRTSAYGGILERSIDLTQLCEGILSLRDRWIKGSSKTLTVNFYLPHGSETLQTASGILVRTQTAFAKFQVTDTAKKAISSSVFKSMPANPIIFSPEIGYKTEAMRIAFTSTYRQGDCMSTRIFFGTANAYFSMPDDKELAKLTQKELASELWKLTPAVKDTENNLSRVISILSPLKKELLNTELLYLLLRTYIWSKNIDNATMLFDILLTRKDMTSSQHINALRELASIHIGNKNKYYYFVNQLLISIHRYNYERFDNLYIKIVHQILDEFNIPSPSDQELQTSFTYPILLKYIYSFRPTNNKYINTFLYHASPTVEHKKLFSSIVEFMIDTNYVEQNFTHYIVTKFCVGLTSPELIEYRLALFKAVTLPSIMKQNNQKFIWLLCVGDIMPIEQLRKLQDLVEPYPNIILLPSGFVHMGAGRAAKGFILQHTKTEYLLISRLDDDDGWELELNSYLHEYVKSCLDLFTENRAITFSGQLRWDANSCSGENVIFPWLSNNIHVLSKFNPDNFFSPYDYRHTKFAEYASSLNMKVDILENSLCRGLWTRHPFTDCTESVKSNQIYDDKLKQILEKRFGVDLSYLNEWKTYCLPKIKNYKIGKYRTIMQQKIDSSFKYAKKPADRVLSLQSLLDIDNFL